ncbi:NUDIX domain-containing protein [Candidatus Woesearchaeota archaeon]|nr:NUDIX domain-containing protein [Candidatus Woesearchaeota archaeon]
MKHDLLTVVDENDLVLGYSTKEDVKRRGLNYRCIQVFLFNDTEELMLCKRPENKKIFAGQWSSVMGHVRKGENYEESAYRELNEETGMNIRLQRVTKFSVLDGANRIFQEIYEGVVTEMNTTDKTEISQVEFKSLRKIRNEILPENTKYAFPFVEAMKAYMKAKNVY